MKTTVSWLVFLGTVPCNLSLVYYLLEEIKHTILGQWQMLVLISEIVAMEVFSVTLPDSFFLNK